MKLVHDLVLVLLLVCLAQGGPTLVFSWLALLTSVGCAGSGMIVLQGAGSGNSGPIVTEWAQGYRFIRNDVRYVPASHWQTTVLSSYQPHPKLSG
jgi:hypothetical protein